MIRHQAIGMYFTSIFFRLEFKLLQIKQIVLVMVETRAAIVAALNDVPGNPGNRKASSSRQSMPPVGSPNRF